MSAFRYARGPRFSGTALGAFVDWVNEQLSRIERALAALSAPTVVTPTYGTTVTIDLSQGSLFEITATDGVAFAVAAPTNAIAGRSFEVRIKNTSGGVLGVVTWNAAYHLAGVWVAPLTGSNRALSFTMSTAALAYEVSRAAADVAN